MPCGPPRVSGTLPHHTARHALQHKISRSTWFPLPCSHAAVRLSPPQPPQAMLPRLNVNLPLFPRCRRAPSSSLFSSSIPARQHKTALFDRCATNDPPTLRIGRTTPPAQGSRRQRALPRRTSEPVWGGNASVSSGVSGSRAGAARARARVPSTRVSSHELRHRSTSYEQTKYIRKWFWRVPCVCTGGELLVLAP